MLLRRIERRSIRALSLDELQRLPMLYRAALSSLSVARTIALDRNLLLYLENIALRAYLAVYGPRVNPGEGLREFFIHDLPAAVRAARWHILVAALALLVGVAAGFILTVQDEAWFSSLMPAGLAGGRGPSSTAADLRSKELFAPWPGAVEAFGIFANVLFSHNTVVGLMCFGLGLAAGIPTLLLAAYQGLSLGAFVALHYNRGLLVECLGWVSIHGTTELGAIILLAAGGLVIADKILFSGALLADRKSRAARPPGRDGGSGRRPDAVRRRHPRRRLPPTGAEHDAAFCDRIGHGRAVVALFQPLRQAGATMTSVPDTRPGAPISVQERAAEFFEGVRRRQRQIITPEGVPITVHIADYGERVTAFALDFVFWLLLIVAIYVPALSLIGTRGSLIAISIALFLGFLVRNLYFIYFELAWHGATPGKRIVGLRVIDHNGGPLLPSAVVARNLTREVEMFIPLGILLQGAQSVRGVIDWSELFTALWLTFFLILPALNRDRMRGGDLIAGTMVIALPKRSLSGDLVEHAVQFSFSPQQLQAYGAFELQVLEELLRRPQGPETMQVLHEVSDKICRKIGWTEPVAAADVAAFLRDFYTAERAFLEREQLYGKARPDKYTPPALSP